MTICPDSVRRIPSTTTVPEATVVGENSTTNGNENGNTKSPKWGRAFNS